MTSRAKEIIDEISDWVNEDVSFLDALVHYSDKNEIELELVAAIVKSSPILMAMATETAENTKQIKTKKRLPL